MAPERAEKTGGAGQLAFELPHRPALGREDFVVGAGNEEAVAVIDRWPDWPQRCFALIGPAGSGKSHLASVWQRRTGATIVVASTLLVRQVPELIAHGCLVIEDGEAVRSETALFHLINAAGEHGASLLITASVAPAQWRIEDAALVSRLSTVPWVQLGSPSDDVLAHVLRKLFRDRQLEIADDLVPYLVARMHRSFAAARDIVTALDRASLARQRPIGKKLAGEILTKSNN